MKQHPIPQDITNYKFHLIGSMTLKQFAELAVTAVLAFIIYKTNLIVIIKWPLIISVVGFGAALAFVPIEERPLDHWVVTFFKRIYQPTKFFWKKSAKTPDFFKYQIHSTQTDFFAPDVNLNPAKKDRISEYIKSIPDEEPADSYDATQNEKVSNIISQFDEVEVDQKEIKIEEPKKQEKPQLKTRVRDLKSPKPTAKAAENPPNQISGQILDKNGSGVLNAIIDIKNEDGESVRILKSSQDGSFLVNRPLENGIYKIIVEKDDLQFPTQQIKLSSMASAPLVFKA